MRSFTIAAAMSVAMLAPVHAQSLTNDRTCAAVQRDFAQTGRVTTRTRSGQVLPIYGGVPWLQRKTSFCGPNQTLDKKYVQTKDDRTCVVSSRCI